VAGASSKKGSEENAGSVLVRSVLAGRALCKNRNYVKEEGKNEHQFECVGRKVDGVERMSVRIEKWFKKTAQLRVVGRRVYQNGSK